MKFLILLTALLLISCGKNLDNVDKTPPAKPNIVSQTYDFSFYTESGIRPISIANHLRVDWNKNSDEDLEGYYLERREIEDSDTAWIRINNEITTDTTYIDDNLTFTNENSLSRYYYRVVAVDEDDNISDPSNTKNFKLLQKAEILDFYKKDTKLIINALYQGIVGEETKYAVLRIIEQDQIVYADPKEEFLVSNDTIKFSVDLDQFSLNVDNIAARVDIVNSINGIHTSASYSQLKSLETNK